MFVAFSTELSLNGHSGQQPPVGSLAKWIRVVGQHLPGGRSGAEEVLGSRTSEWAVPREMKQVSVFIARNRSLKLSKVAKIKVRLPQCARGTCFYAQFSEH